MKQPVLRPGSRQDYSDWLTRFIQPQVGHLIMQNLNTAAVNAFYAGLIEQGETVCTITHVHRPLHALLEFAVVEGVIPINPATHATRPHGKRIERPKALDEKQARTFLIATRDSRLNILYQTAIFTGARIGELSGLRWSDIDFDHKTISIVRQITARKIKGQPRIPSQPKSWTGEPPCIFDKIL
jgi:integrase